jgi:hypothetical protein
VYARSRERVRAVVTWHGLWILFPHNAYREGKREKERECTLSYTGFSSVLAPGNILDLDRFIIYSTLTPLSLPAQYAKEDGGTLEDRRA